MLSQKCRQHVSDLKAPGVTLRGKQDKGEPRHASERARSRRASCKHVPTTARRDACTARRDVGAAWTFEYQRRAGGRLPGLGA